MIFYTIVKNVTFNGEPVRVVKSKNGGNKGKTMQNVSFKFQIINESKYFWIILYLQEVRFATYMK